MSPQRGVHLPTEMASSGPLRAPLEMWGGIEATVNRVGDRYCDQVALTGHDERITDLDLLATLGITAIRYPVLWERTVPEDAGPAAWEWPDRRLERLAALQIRPIVGLLHHGSGPSHTNLLDPDFPERLADYACAVARRYPWVTDYTPINEPLTTARFSALYGHWYPHARDDASFARAILNQCKATVLAMQAIRSVNPDARLVQTEDVGRTHGTSHMAYQVDFENERRWLTFDLLTGRLGEGTRMSRWLRYVGIPDDDIMWFSTHPSPPDLLAINYYLTSERFLDERLSLYPNVPAGGNERDTYIDIAALHALPEGIGGFRGALAEPWKRYRIPVCLGEVHLGGRPEEQMRWLNDAWWDAHVLRAEGADVRAVTAWALLGSFDWPSLVTRSDGHYERGAFDIRSGIPRPTALARMIRALALWNRYGHPLLAAPAWWRRPDRLFPCHAARLNEGDGAGTGPCRTEVTPRDLLLAGEDTPLQRAILHECRLRQIPARAIPPREILKFRHSGGVPGAWAVIASDLSGDVPDGPLTLIEQAAHRAGIPLVVVSQSGRRSPPPSENAGVLKVGIDLLFGPGLESNLLECEQGLDHIAPAYLPDVANTLIDLLIDGETGAWHLHAGDPVTGAAFLSSIRSVLFHSPSGTADTRHRSKTHCTPNERIWRLPDWQNAVSHYVDYHRQAILAALNEPGPAATSLPGANSGSGQVLMD